ncbi:hypothetical protein MPSEU_000593500 [Mayamaea pseudoterrestris]|nr:hypothetical protein MPSEU_000593500 [Mayamaea pseudoterrestris]
MPSTTRCYTRLTSLLGTLLLSQIHAFVSPPMKLPVASSATVCNIDHCQSKRFLARLYEDPLPPRRAPSPTSPKSTDDDDDEDDDDYVELPADNSEKAKINEERLFQFDSTGTEVNNLLPSLGRSLASNIPCYFEPSDRKVVNLMNKAFCGADDACWALEACKGDILEAWTLISMARRKNYSSNIASSDNNQDSSTTASSVDKDLYELEREEEFQERKEERFRLQAERDRDELFRGGTPDQNVWPNLKPGPDESEPWFTG